MSEEGEGERPQYLSYSGRTVYTRCPEEWRRRYDEEDKTRLDPRGSFFGSSMGKLAEWFYEKRVWAMPDPVASCRAMIDPAIRLTFQHDGYDPKDEPVLRDKIRSDMWDLVPAMIRIIQEHKLLTEDSQAEVNLTVTVSNPDYDFALRFGGRADFIHGRGEGRWIVDGKGSEHREKFVDADQLVWYALLHYLKYHVAPRRIGFLYWRFPEDPVQWVDYDGADMKRVYDETWEVARKIRLRLFDPTPNEHCERCDFRPDCAAGKEYLSERQVEARNEVIGSIFDLDEV